MPFNGSGVFLRVRNWVNDATAGIKIRADFHDSEDDNIAQGLSQCITKDGQTTVTANLPMATYRHTNVGAATQLTQYARYDQVSGGQANWAVAGGTGNAITASFPVPLGTITDGQEINIRLTNSNTGTSITLAADGGSAFPIVKANGDDFIDGEFYAGREVTLRYRDADTSWVMVGTQGASDVSYNNTGSGLSATNVQDAIDEAVSDFSDFEGRVDGFATAAQGALADTALQPGFSNIKSPIVKATTSGTSVTFSGTDIPAGTKRIILNLMGMSTSGAGIPLVRLGAGGTPLTTGYLGSGVALTTGSATAPGTGGFPIRVGDLAAIVSGQVTLTLADSVNNIWTASVSCASASAVYASAGSIALSGTLNIIEFLSGVGNFDAGSVSIVCET